jgi:hypothetical protein
MSIVLQSLLPKLHLNRNTAQSIIFGPELYGGLSIPNIHTLQGCTKISLFLGHVWLQDKTGKLLQIGLSHLQLSAGFSPFILNLPFHTHSSWLDQSWLISLWEFSSYAKVTYKVSSVWLPECQRENDVYLMEFLLTQTQNSHTLSALNRCRLFLQVIQLSGITSANGTHILPEVKHGHLYHRKVPCGGQSRHLSKNLIGRYGPSIFQC